MGKITARFAELLPRIHAFKSKQFVYNRGQMEPVAILYIVFQALARPFGFHLAAN
jgi:hypothetical protein